MTKFLVVVSAAMYAIATAARCQPSTTFETEGKFSTTIGKNTYWGIYRWGNDVAGNRAITESRGFEGSTELDVWTLLDYNNHVQYTESSEHTSCATTRLNGTLPPMWTWLPDAKFLERRAFHGVEVDVYGLHYSATGFIGIGCLDSDPTTPVGFMYRTPTETTEITFYKWYPSIVNASLFTPLSNC